MSKIVIQWGVSLLMVVSAGACWAQDAASYPARTIRIIIALAPGGGVDTSGRLLGQKFTDAWGQQVVAENRAGAGGTIATELVARAAPDGYTLLMQSMSHAITPALYKLSYDTTTVRLFREQYQLVAGGGGVFGRIDALNGLGDELDDGDFLEQVDLQDRENRVQTGRQFQLFARDRYQ